MSKTSVVTMRLDEETIAQMDKLAKGQGRSRAWFAAQAIRRAVESESEFAAFVQAGIDAADRGEYSPQDEVFARIRARRDKRNAT